MAAADRLDWRIMVETESQVSELAGELQRVLSKVFSVLRRGDTNRTEAGDLTLAQLSILLTLLDQGPIRMTELAARQAQLATLLAKLSPEDLETLTKALAPLERLAE